MEPRSGVSRATGQSFQSLQAQVKECADLNVLPPRVETLGGFISRSTAVGFRVITPWRLRLVQLNNFTQLLCSNGFGGLFVFNCALVGEFMFTFLPVFSVLQTAVLPTCFLIVDMLRIFGLTVFLGHSPSFCIYGAPSIRPDLSSQLSCRGSLDARRSSFSSCEFLFFTFGRCCSCSCCFQVVRSLNGSVHRAPFISAMEFTSHSWSHS